MATSGPRLAVYRGLCTKSWSVTECRVPHNGIKMLRVGKPNGPPQARFVAHDSASLPIRDGLGTSLPLPS